MSSRCVRAALLACILSLSLAAQASAVELLRFEPGGAVSANGPMTFESEGARVTCTVTLTGTLTSRLVEASRGAAIGSITRGASTCEGAEIIILTPIPIVLERLLSQAGRIVGVLARLDGGGILVDSLLGLARCLYGIRTGVLIGIQVERTTVRFLGEPLTLVRTLPGSVTCPRTSVPAGTLELTPTQSVVFLP